MLQKSGFVAQKEHGDASKCWNVIKKIFTEGKGVQP